MSLVENKNIETNKQELTIKVDADTFEAAIQKAYLKNVKKIEVQGFRKGKAPRKMVEKVYGEGVFFEDAINDLYPQALQDAITESGLEVVARPEVEITDVSKEEGFSFTAICVTKPEISIKDYKGLEIEKLSTDVTDEDVDKKLDALREKGARMIDVEDRAAQDGDTVVFDFEGFVDGEAFAGGKAESFSLVLGSGQFIPGFEPQIVGKAIGEDFDVEVSFPEDYQAEELKGKPAVFKCKIHEIKVKELPELDDEFAKDTSEFDTLDELKADLVAKTLEEKQTNSERDFQGKIIDAVIEKMEGEVPQEMFDAQVESMIRNMEYRLQPQGISLDVYLQYTGMTMDSLRKTYAVQAEREVRFGLALEKIVELENIEVSDDELTAEYEKLAENYKMDVEQIKGFVPAVDLKHDIASNKAIQMLKDSAKVK